MRKRPDPLAPVRWSVFRNGDDFAVVPHMPLLVRLRQMIPDTFFGQEALRPLKSLLDTNFIIGPFCIIAALYVTRIGLILMTIGVASLFLSALYWFASHRLCAAYLRYRGYTEAAAVEAPDLDAARKAAAP